MEPITTSEKVTSRKRLKAGDLENAIADWELSEAFLDPEYSLARFSVDLGRSAKYLSMFVNSHLGQTFPEYINGLRLRYLIRLLDQGLYDRRVVLADLAARSGFSRYQKFSYYLLKSSGLKPVQLVDRLISEMDLRL